MNKKNYIPLIAIFSLLVFFNVSSLFAAESTYESMVAPEDKDEFSYDSSGDVVWKEDNLNSLVPPKDDDLVALDIDQPPVGFKVFIDKTSIQVSESDSVIRYWLVLTAGKNTRNAMYEGIRCTTSEYKTYAFENKWKKGKVNISKVAKWQPIKKGGHNHFHFELAQYYFCSDVLPRPIEDIQDIIAGYKTTTGDYDPSFHHAN